MNRVVVAAAKRTPIGKFLGQFQRLSAVELGAEAVRGALETCDIPPDAIDEVIFGNARQAGNGPNPARQVMYKSGIPVSKPAFTVNKACASSLKAVTLAWQAIALGDAEIVVAGGAENMTRTPFLLDQMRMGHLMGHTKAFDAQFRDGFLCPLCGQLMGETAENLADKYGISREEQDRYAFESQRRYAEAKRKGEFDEETVRMEGCEDEHPRSTTMEELAKLRPVFRKDGTVTAGNACGIADAAAAVVLVSEARAKRLGLAPLARILGYTQVGVDPAYMGVGPVEAVRALEKKISVKLDRFDLVELNEAFAVQVLACRGELGLDLARTNVNGGAIALGHPIGATGARIVVTLLHEMARRRAKLGLATLCVSGGLGMAVAFENCSI
jgi:acetyl-CoA C-acetyltransferase